MERKISNIGIISTRIAGTDGVSLEIRKWTDVLERNGYSCFFFAGEIDRPGDKSYQVDLAHFKNPDVEKINAHGFGKTTRPKEISDLVRKIKDKLKYSIDDFIRRFDIDLIIPENALTIPMNIPLGLAITEYIAETSIPTIAHHHDFYWERDRFLINAVGDYLQKAFPPNLPSIQHVVLNSIASQALSYRVGVSNTVVPNVYNYAFPPQMSHPEILKSLRSKVGLGDDDIFILQPTRVVQRKAIERSVELVSRLKLPRPFLIISHASGDEGSEYYKRINEYASLMNVKILSLDHLIVPDYYEGDFSENKYTIGDMYQAADLVSYPSAYEGFGNAFLEAIYYKKPIVVNRYTIFISDIEPKGFDLLLLDGFVTGKTINSVKTLLSDNFQREQMVDKNYQIARRHFSYERLERILSEIIERF
ncbi:MAG: glycosyltransferase family 4 protein [Syntrophobacterales bacterium]|nr:glycosyltransferase family 4 protein [Syntrophobacterales bacterium]